MRRIKLNGTTQIPTPLALAGLGLILTALLGFANFGHHLIIAGDASVQQRVTITHEWMTSEFDGIEEQIAALSVKFDERYKAEVAFREGIVQRVAVLETKADE